MDRVTLVHWNEGEARERLARLAALGFDADWFGDSGNQGQHIRYRTDPPAALVIDLGRLPSHGREVATAMRQQKATRGIPLVFVEGEAEKVARIRQMLPDATYTSWAKLRGVLPDAIRNPPANPVVWKSESGAYSGTPLPKKLGLKAGTTVLLLGAPAGFEKRLGAIVKELTLRTRAAGKAELILLFSRTQADLVKRLAAAKRCLDDGGSMWVAWPKKTSGVVSDLSEGAVRQTLLAAGLVDYKVCAIDETWSGLKFACRRK